MPPRERPGTTVQQAALELLPTGAVAPFPVRGASMAPTLEEGHEVAVEIGASDLRRGDLLLFRQADYLTVHRFLGEATTRDGLRCLRTRGDGRTRLDPPLARSDVVGRVVAARRGGRWRSLRARRGRAYAWAVAVHDLAWAALADRVGGESRLHAVVVALDRVTLRLAHRALFTVLHPPIASPGAGS